MTDFKPGDTVRVVEDLSPASRYGDIGVVTEETYMWTLVDSELDATAWPERAERIACYTVKLWRTRENRLFHPGQLELVSD